MQVLRERVCTEYRGKDAGDLGTDGGDHATVLSDGFHANWPSRGAIRCLSATSNGCRRRNGDEHRLTGLWNGLECDEKPEEHHHSKLRQHAAERVAEGSRK